MNEINTIPEFIDKAMDNLETLFAPINAKDGLDLEIVDKDNNYTWDNIAYTNFGVKVTVKNPKTGKPFDILVMEKSDVQDFRERIVESAKNILENNLVDPNIRPQQKEKERLKKTDLIYARKIIDAMSDKQCKYEISQARKKGLTLEKHIAIKKLVSIK